MEKKNSGVDLKSPPEYSSQQRTVCVHDSSTLTQDSASPSPRLPIDYYEPGHKWSLKDLEIEKCLGEGSFGRVYLAREKKSKFIFALKRMSKKTYTSTSENRQLRREIHIQRTLFHPNIVRLYGHFHDTEHVYLMLEFSIGGDLHNKLQEKGKFDEGEVAAIIKDLADAVNYCHSKNVIHRDLKLENLLIGHYGEIKIADFGWSVHSPYSRRRTICGSLDYRAPEIIKKKAYDEQVDVWSLGIILFQLLVGSTPFKEDSASETKRRIQACDIIYPPDLTVKQDARDLIGKFLVINPRRRIALENVESHPFIKRGTEKLLPKSTTTTKKRTPLV